MDATKRGSEVAVRRETQVKRKARQRDAIEHRTDSGVHSKANEVLMHRHASRGAEDATEVGRRCANFRGQATKGQPLTEP